MKFLAFLLIFGNFVYIESLNPRSVNVALETVLEFDGKHSYRDVKAIDKLQSYLTKIKSILGDNDASRRHLKEGFKFRDFLKICLQTLSTYDDNDLLDVVAIANSEIRKYHYKGCKFYELVENQNMRRDMADTLLNLNELTAKELRTGINKAHSAVDNDVMSVKKKKMLDYLDSVYVGDEIKGKMQQFLAELDQFKQRSKRASLNLLKVIKDGLRSVLFDHYSNLNDNARKELKNRLEIIWQDLTKVKEDVWDINQITEKPVVAKNTINQGVWKTITTKSIVTTGNDIEIVYPKKIMVRKKPKGRKRKKSKHLESSPVAQTKKHKKTTTTTETPTVKESSSTEVTSVEATEVTTTKRTHIRKRTHMDEYRKVQKGKRRKTKTTPMKETSEEVEPSKLRKTRTKTTPIKESSEEIELSKLSKVKTKSTPMRDSSEEMESSKLSKVRTKTTPMKDSSEEMELSKFSKIRAKTTPTKESSEEMNLSRFSNAKDSLEAHKKRLPKKRKPKQKQRKGKQKLRKQKNVEPILRVRYRSQSTLSTESEEPSENTRRRRHTRAMRKSNDEDKFKGANETENVTKADITITPSVIHSINRIEKVLDEIKDIVKNVTIYSDVSETSTTQKNVNTSTQQNGKIDEEKKVLQGRKSFVENGERDLEEIKNTYLTTKQTKRINGERLYNIQAIKVSTDTKSTVQKYVKNLSTKPINIDDAIIIMKQNTNLIKDTAKDETVTTSIKKKLTINDHDSKSTITTLTDYKLNDTHIEDRNKNVADKTVLAHKKEIEKMINETRRAEVDNVIGRHDDENKEMNETIDKKIDGHMKRLLSITGKVDSTKPFDFDIGDPFDTKEDIHEDAFFR